MGFDHRGKPSPSVGQNPSPREPELGKDSNDPRKAKTRRLTRGTLVNGSRNTDRSVRDDRGLPDAPIPADPVFTQLFADLRLAQRAHTVIPESKQVVDKFERQAWRYLVAYLLSLKSPFDRERHSPFDRSED